LTDSAVSVGHLARHGDARSDFGARTMKRRLTAGYNAKSKNQNTLISGTWHGSHAGNKTACTPPHVAPFALKYRLHVGAQSPEREREMTLKSPDYLYVLFIICPL